MKIDTSHAKWWKKRGTCLNSSSGLPKWAFACTGVGLQSLRNQRISIRNVDQGGATISILTLMLSSFDRYRTCVYEIEGDGVSHLSCTSDRYNIIIYPMTSPCMCSPLEAMSTGRSLGTFPVVMRQCASVPVRRVSSQTQPHSSLRGCSGEAWNPTRSSVPVRRVSSQKRPRSSLRRCNEEAWEIW